MKRGSRLAAFLGGAAALLCLAALQASAGEVEVQSDIVYADFPAANGKPAAKLLLDVYAPGIGFKGKRPGILWIHGGGWSGGTKKDFAPFAIEMARKGFVNFCISYRLLPNFRYPAQVDDAQRAVRWIRAHAADFHLDPNRLGAAGGSAGGHLVAMLGTRDTRDNSDKSLARYNSRVQCVVDIFGPTDFTIPDDSPSISPAARMILLNFFGKKPSEARDLYRDGSPIVYVTRRSAPFLIIHGDKDPLVPVDQSKRMHAALEKAGASSTLIILEGEGHGIVKPENLQKVKEAIAAFFTKHLKP